MKKKWTLKEKILAWHENKEEPYIKNAKCELLCGRTTRTWVELTTGDYACYACYACYISKTHLAEEEEGEEE